jgi:hypothetical protein
MVERWLSASNSAAPWLGKGWESLAQGRLPETGLL